MKLMLFIFLLVLLNAPGLCLDVNSLMITEFMADNSSIIPDGNDDYPDWVEIHNPGLEAVSLAGCHLTDDADNLAKWTFPASASVPANGYLIVFASGNATDSTPYIDSMGYIHTSFKLSMDGESIALVAPNGSTLISAWWDFPLQGTDVSYGLGANEIHGFMRPPTPGAANGGASPNGFIADTRFNIKRGIYYSSFAVTISCATENTTIRYTFDCSTPTETNGTTYTGPIPISQTTILRASAFRDGWVSPDVDTQTYIFPSRVISQPDTKPNSLWPDPFRPSIGTTRQAIDYGMDAKVTQNDLYKNLMNDALLAIPSISLVTDLPNLFDTATGIYVNPGGEGDEWERPACVELIFPDGSEGFHANAGIRIRGGVSASRTNPKHSFRVIMRSKYGDSRIEYPLLGPDGPETFDKIDFRTAQNFSWNFNNPQYANWLDDPFSRDTMRDMGHPSTNGFFFHLYLNGLYWGLYQIEERPDDMFCTFNLGARESDYDVVKSDEDTGIMYSVEGSTDLYFNFWTQVKAGVTTAADYFKLQGKNSDGTVNPGYIRYLDPCNLIDYMLIVFFTGARDMPLGPPNENNKPRNLYAVVNHTNPDGFKYIPHDNEYSLLKQSGVSINRVSVTLLSTLGNQTFFNPWWLHSTLKANPEYALHFADRVHRHFFNGGVLTPAACTARYQARIDEISLGIIAESARWGDYLSPSTARTKDKDWLPSANWVLNNFFNATPSTRTDIVLSQLKNAGLYPSVDAPEFNRHGGTVNYGFPLQITAASGTIYYTTDGSDPRMIGGAVGGTAISGVSGLNYPIVANTTVKARAMSGSTWSALTDADFIVTNTPTPTPTPEPHSSAWESY